MPQIAGDSWHGKVFQSVEMEKLKGLCEILWLSDGWSPCVLLPSNNNPVLMKGKTESTLNGLTSDQSALLVKHYKMIIQL